VKDVDPDELLNVDGEAQRQTENILEFNEEHKDNLQLIGRRYSDTAS